MDYLAQKRKHLKYLEILWLFLMAFCAVPLLHFSGLAPLDELGASGNLRTVASYLTLTAVFAPRIIQKAVDLRRIITPFDKPTMWESETVIIATTVCLLTIGTWISFSIPITTSFGVVLSLLAIFSPVRVMAAKTRGQIMAWENPNVSGSPDGQAVFGDRETKARVRNNAVAYSAAILTSAAVQSISLAGIILALGKTEVFSFFHSFVFVGFIIFFTLGTWGTGLSSKLFRGQNWTPTFHYFNATVIFSLVVTIAPMACLFFGFLSGNALNLQAGFNLDLILIGVVFSYVLGGTAGSLVFGKLYKLPSAAVAFA